MVALLRARLAAGATGASDSVLGVLEFFSVRVLRRLWFNRRWPLVAGCLISQVPARARARVCLCVCVCVRARACVLVACVCVRACARDREIARRSIGPTRGSSIKHDKNSVLM
jgi:hypothetical protein